jgi:hypothetical protein
VNGLVPDTKPFRVDLRHKTLIQAIADGVWDVITIGFNLLNQSARETVLLPATVDVDAELARLDRVVEPHGGSLPDLAYRFVREAAGISSVLVGTGNPTTCEPTWRRSRGRGWTWPCSRSCRR